jgi:AcrR family transcriptional regulator
VPDHPASTSPTTHRLGADERRRQILDAALKLFAHHGYGGTTTKAIAKEAGITEGLIYHYFGGKAELLVDLAKGRSALLQQVGSLLRDEGDVPVTRTMPRIARGWVELVRHQGDLVIMLVSESHAHPEVGAAFAALLDEVRGGLSAYLDRRVAAGELRADLPTPVAAASFLSALLMFFYTHADLDDAIWEVEARRFTEALLDVWLRGALAHGDAP